MVQESQKKTETRGDSVDQMLQMSTRRDLVDAFLLRAGHEAEHGEDRNAGDHREERVGDADDDGVL